MTLIKIISGGQTGADQGGLEAGRELGLETGGTAPQRFMTELGTSIKLRDIYGLIEGSYDPRIYPMRTKMNVLNSDATVIFGSVSELGSQLTKNLCVKHNKPCILFPIECLIEALRPKTVLEAFRDKLDTRMISEARAERWGTSNSLADFLKHNNVKVLNVAGNRESVSPGIQGRVKEFLVRELKG